MALQIRVKKNEKCVDVYYKDEFLFRMEGHLAGMLNTVTIDSTNLDVKFKFINQGIPLDSNENENFFNKEMYNK